MAIENYSDKYYAEWDKYSELWKKVDSQLQSLLDKSIDDNKKNNYLKILIWVHAKYRRIKLPNDFTLEREFSDLLSEYKVELFNKETNEFYKTTGVKRLTNLAEENDSQWEINLNEVPDYLFEIPSLEELKLVASNNQITPKSLFNENFKAEKLTTLNLTNVPVSDLNWLENLSNFKDLSIKNAPLNELPEWLNLNELILDNVNINIIPDSAFPKQSLRIRNCKNLSLANIKTLTQWQKWKWINICEIIWAELSKEDVDWLNESAVELTIKDCTTNWEPIDDIHKEFDPMMFM